MDIDKIAKAIKEHGFKIASVMDNSEFSLKLIADRKNERVFLKIFKLSEIFKSLESKEWINNEIKMGEMIASSSIHTACTMIEKLYTQKHLILVYEYYRHRTLEQVITERKLRDRDIKLILRDLVRILDDLRKLGLVHKHLSVDKLIVANNMLKFTGLDNLQPVSITKEIEFRNNQNISKRTSNFNSLAPEVVLNRFIGFKTQVFSFGVVLYVITHGFWPYESTSLQELRNCYLDKDYKPFIDPNLHPKIYYLIQRTIAVDYNDRIGLTEIKKEIHAMYKGIKHYEDSIRTKLYFIRNPNLKATSGLIGKKSKFEKQLASNKVMRGMASSKLIGGMIKNAKKRSVSPKKSKMRSHNKFPKIGSMVKLSTNKSFDDDDLENSGNNENEISEIEVIIESELHKAKAGGFFEIDPIVFERKKRRNFPTFLSNTARYERLKFKKIGGVATKRLDDIKLPMIRSSRRL